MNPFDSILRAVSSTSNGQAYQLLLPVALILFLTKGISIGFSKLKLPQVIGYLVAGLLVGLISFIPSNPQWESIFGTYSYLSDGINILAKFGVVMILFSAGVETDLKSIKAVGVAAMVITSLGVIVPLALGFTAAYLFRVYGGLAAPAGISNPIYTDLYYGVILSATSVSITVATLKELGRLETRVGNAIVSAAIIDDVIGIVLLSLIISLSGSTSGSSEFNLLEWIITAISGQALPEAAVPFVVIINMAIFFLISWGISFFVRRFFNFLGTKYPHHIRIPIYSLAFCFLWAFVAQAFFEIADITGGYIAGLILSATSPKNYIDHRAETTSNVFFVPIFFASVAMKMYSGDFSNFFTNPTFLYFGLIWVFVGLLGKVLGAGSGALMCRFKPKDSLKIGVGMMARAEVLIVTAQTGVDSGLISDKIIPFTLILILISSFITPILLKLLYKNDPPENIPGDPISARSPLPATPEDTPAVGDKVPTETNSSSSTPK
jgi:Kef-type K+ transport system membrane component KefB